MIGIFLVKIMASANLKAFVSETELEEQRQKRQEEWEKVRTADQPEECPEEEYDPRSLYEKLQEEKDKKQSDYEEQFKFKNMIRGIDEEETKFLNDVAEQQMKIDMERMSEEKKLINEYKESVMNRTVSVPSQSVALSKPASDKKVVSGTKRSQASLLAGAVKRKRPPSVDGSSKAASESLASSSDSSTAPASDPVPGPPAAPGTNPSRETSGNDCNAESIPQVECIAILPGIGSYSNSSEESDSESSESEIETVKTVFHSVGQRTKCSDK